MTIAAAAVGVACLMAVAGDLLTTTLGAQAGAGPVTRWLGRGVATSLLRLGGRSRPATRLAVGPAVLVATAVAWFLGLVVAWCLVLVPFGLEDTATGAGAASPQRLAFVVSTLSSLGPGYVRPTSGAGSVVAATMSVSGIGLITLSITYVLPVITAVSHRQVQAAAMSAQGSTAAEIASRLAEDPDEAHQLVRALTHEIRLLGQRHRAYPVLHHFRAAERRTAFALNLREFDDAVRCLEETGRLSPVTASSFHAAVDELLVAAQPHLRVVLDEEVGAEPDRARLFAAYVDDAGWPSPVAS